MLKYVCATGLLATILVSLPSEIVYSRPSPTTNLSSSALDINSNTPLCYLQTSDGRILDLGKLCEKSSQNSPPNSALKPTSNPVGANGCYLFDPSGRPCPTAKGDRK